VFTCGRGYNAEKGRDRNRNGNGSTNENGNGNNRGETISEPKVPHQVGGGYYS
jgi:hypothetical protein